MAKPGLVLPRFYPTDIINGGRVDEHIRALADQVNGGLTVHNLAPQTRIAQTGFLEGRSVFTISNTLDFGLAYTSLVVGALDFVTVGVSPAVPTRLISASFCGLMPANGAFNVNNPWTLEVAAHTAAPLVVNSLYSTRVVPPIFAKKGTRLGANAGPCIILNASYYAPTDIAASTVFSMRVKGSSPPATYSRVYLSITLSAPHQA